MSYKDLLSSRNQFVIKQRRELFELVGFESRNKYEVLTTEGESLLFIAENQKDLLGMLLRQFVGHWRSFDLGIFDSKRQLIAKANHPFKFIFPELHLELSGGELSSGELSDSARKSGSQHKIIGHSVKNFSIFSKKYSIYLNDNSKYEINSGFFSPWTFIITKNNQEVASIKKKWSGGLKEIFTDSDNFFIEFNDPNSSPELKLLIIALVVLIDLNHFERKAN